MLKMLIWSLRLDRQLLFRIAGLPLSWKLSLVLKKYALYCTGAARIGAGKAKSLMVFGSRFWYNEPLAPASIERVYCSSHHLLGILPERPVVVDVGANVGQFNLFARQYLGARRIVSVEPDPVSFELLRCNAVLAADCLCCAVSDREGEVLFHVASESSQLSSYLAQPDAGYRGSFTVPARTLDAIVVELGVGEVDLLKIDTEGSELDVLKSAEDLLARTRYVLVEMSVFRRSAGNLFRIGTFLEERGFELVRLSACDEGRPRDVDGLFRRS